MAFELIPAISISTSGLNAEQTRMKIIANNLANANSTRGENGEVYRRRSPVFSAVFSERVAGAPVDTLGGVKLDEVAIDSRPPTEIYAPHHPDANADGMLQVPNVSPIEEMVDMISASRAYEANLALVRSSKKMADEALRLSKGGA